MNLENPLNPSLNLDFHDLYSHEGLCLLDEKFHQFFTQKNPQLHQKFLALKSNPQTFDKKIHDAILIDSARIVEDFIGYIFQIENDIAQLKKDHDDLQKIYFVKREFVQRVVAKKFSGSGTDNPRIARIKKSELNKEDVALVEKTFAEKIYPLLQKENLSEEEKSQYDDFTRYAVWALFSEEGKQTHEGGALFKLPKKIDHQKLFEFEDKNGMKSCANHKNRDGFNLTDEGFNLNQALGEAHYCIFCHKQNKDSCRSGLVEKEKFKTDPLGLELHGCPLDQKISEMNLLKSEGLAIASLAIAAIDNPLMAGTGHRICNDCMKSCIFQKQDPVNIPQIESENLKDILILPYGFEIYSLLTRWNPLNFGQSVMQKNSGKKILIAGLGPAGYTLAHYLLNDGHTVVAIDGLKIEPLDPEISGIDVFGNRQKFKPIKYLDDIYQPLSSRLIQGFGGVAEYGITVRWDKNFLTIIRLLLERRENFRMFGGLRFGSSITDKSAFEEYGFDHVALCIGAGRPKIIDIKNNFAKGIRSSSDFLMSLQLTGAFKKDLFTNLQLRAPILVVGGGLTAVDCACEAQAYYLTQIKKFARKFEELSQFFGEEKIWSELNEEEKIIAHEFLDHAQIVDNQGAEELWKKIGVTKILYRKKIADAPSYRLNHQELENGLQEGIEFIENTSPSEAVLDSFGHIEFLKCQDEKIFPCRALLIAAGTTPNVSPILEDNLDLKLDGYYPQMIDERGHEIQTNHSAKPRQFSTLTKIDTQGRAVSFFGDLHPNFEGNVVKAMSSAKNGHKQITRLLNTSTNNNDVSFDGFLQKINSEFLVQIHEINALSDYVFEIIIKAPLLAHHTQIGQIFRLQNYHAFAPKIKDQTMAMEGVAVTALDVDVAQGLIKGIVTNYGGSTALIKNFRKNDPCIFMGPSGKPTEIAQNETVVLIGGGRGHMPLTHIARVYKMHGCKIIFCVGYKKSEYIVLQSEMEKFSDVLIYAIEDDVDVQLNRSQDRFYQGTAIDALQQYFSQNHEKIDRIFTIGGDKMMAEIARLRHENIIPQFAQAPIAITSLNAPMQCMMKGVCSQCLQKRTDDLGNVEYFYSCANQDQDTDRLDFKHLHARCGQNSLQEKVTKLWIEYLEPVISRA